MNIRQTITKEEMRLILRRRKESVCFQLRSITGKVSCMEQPVHLLQCQVDLEKALGELTQLVEDYADAE